MKDKNTAATAAPILPFYVAWRLRRRSTLMTGFRFGASAEEVRSSLLAALREASNTAEVSYVRACTAEERALLERPDFGGAK